MAVSEATQKLNALSLGGQRKHVVIFSRECLFLSEVPHAGQQTSLNAELDVLASTEYPQFELHFTSYGPHQQEESAAATLRIPAGSCIHRSQLREFIRSCWDAGKVVIVCGTVKEDMYIAAHTKSFLIAASWVPLAAEVQKYGIPAPTPIKMRTLIEIVANQTGWYYSCTFNSFPVPVPAGPVPVPVPAGPVLVPVPVPTKVVSLCLGNTYAGVNGDEKSMAKAFRAILKDGADNPIIKEALFCHLMAAIAHDNDFREVQDWAVAPASSCSPNQVMEELKERVRCMMYGRKHAPIFFRHTSTDKSRKDLPQMRQNNLDYCQKHFKSIRVNNEYRGKLKGRVVCVLDDYLTHGNTFEALRNLLVACEVRKIIFVSIGKFNCNNYHQKDFCIQGDVHTANYTATFNRHLQHNVQFDDNARRSLKDLKTLAFNYLQ